MLYTTSSLLARPHYNVPPSSTLCAIDGQTLRLRYHGRPHGLRTMARLAMETATSRCSYSFRGMAVWGCNTQDHCSRMPRVATAAAAVCCHHKTKGQL